MRSYAQEDRLPSRQHFRADLPDVGAGQTPLARWIRLPTLRADTRLVSGDQGVDVGGSLLRQADVREGPTDRTFSVLLFRTALRLFICRLGHRLVQGRLAAAVKLRMSMVGPGAHDLDRQWIAPRSSSNQRKNASKDIDASTGNLEGSLQRIG